MAEPKPTIGVVGPMPPYRSGIAYYSDQLVRALRSVADVHVVSFKRLYPAWLYPGDELTALQPTSQVLPNVAYLLDTYDPFSLERAARFIIRAPCQVVIINWWTLYWQPALVYMAWRLQRRGVRVIFLCHNLFDHDSKGPMRVLSERLLRRADGYMVHATEKAQLLQQIKPTAVIMQRNLPIFDQFVAPKVRLPKRGRLELLFFGYIRPYKGLDTLLSALERLGDRRVHTTIAGELWGDDKALRARLNALAKKVPLELHLEFSDDATAAAYFRRADVLVLPYRSATGSAVVSLAYSYSKPVLATSVGGLKDVVSEGRTGWLVPPDSPDELAKAIRTITRPMAATMKPAIQAFCRENSWETFAQKTIAFSHKLMKERP